MAAKKINDDIMECWEALCEDAFDVLDALEEADVHEIPEYPSALPSFDEVANYFIVIRDACREVRREAGA